MIVSGAQIRAARGLLGWTQARLARASGLHPNAIAYWEGHKDIPTGIWREPVACRRIRAALLEVGVEFLQLPVVGVRLAARHNKATSTRRRARAHHGVLRFSRPRKCKTSVIPAHPVKVRGRSLARACAARTRTGRPCVRRALANGRCPNHGGLSSGPKSEAGRQRIAEAQKQRWARWRSRQSPAGRVTDSSES
jgi:hypothetical protein